MAEHLGFIGVGRMGSPMAGRLIDAGHKLTIFDTNRAATAPLVAAVRFRPPPRASLRRRSRP